MATSVPFVYACGDCAGQPLQVAKAVGEGNVAAISCAEDLAHA
jgi:thioredoxin reductase (NADPH)